MNLLIVSRNFKNYIYSFKNKTIKCNIYTLYTFIQTIDKVILFLADEKKNSKKKDPFGISNYLTIIMIIFKNTKLNINLNNFFKTIKKFYRNKFKKKKIEKKIKIIIFYIKNKMLQKKNITLCRKKNSQNYENINKRVTNIIKKNISYNKKKYKVKNNMYYLFLAQQKILLNIKKKNYIRLKKNIKILMKKTNTYLDTVKIITTNVAQTLDKISLLFKTKEIITKI